MLFTEWKLEDAQQVWFEEGIEKGRKEGRLETARALFAEGDSIEKIARTTGLSLETLKENLRVQ